MTRHCDPTTPRFVSYLRVSTDRQGRSGLAAEYVEIESGKRSDRPQLAPPWHSAGKPARFW